MGLGQKMSYDDQKSERTRLAVQTRAYLSGYRSFLHVKSRSGQFVRYVYLL